METWIWIATAATLATLISLLPEPKKIFGIYSQPGKYFYLKAAFIYISIKLRKLKSLRNKTSKPDSSDVDSEQAGYGMRITKAFEDMERPVKFKEDDAMAIDAVFFSCGGKDGTYMIASSARRQLGMNNSILLLRIPGVGVLTHPKHPDTTLFTSTDKPWHAEGLEIDMVEPMKQWTVKYEGNLVHQKTKKVYKCKLETTFTSIIPYFDFDADMDAWSVAKAFAREPWSREYFDQIRKAHQNHYQHLGDLHGVAVLDGVEHNLAMQLLRDHTHGARDWRLMHRYAIQHFTTEKGFRAFVGVICQPGTFSSLEIGYAYIPDGGGRTVPVTEVDLPLWAFGEKTGEDPMDYSFRFKAEGVWHEVMVNVVDKQGVYLGWEWECQLVERFCEFTVDGVGGWGVSEFHYRHRGGRPKELEMTDPEYTRNAVKF